jgi:ATP-dependent DNA helicase PIF1
MRNMNGEQGLCDGMRLKVCRLVPNCIDAMIMTGNQQGKRVFLPRIMLISHDSGLPSQLCRRQFPVQVSFAMTINKAQGQSVDHLSLYLPQHILAHGQLYFALSRVTSRSNIKIQLQEGDHQEQDSFCIKNVVYKEIIQ